MLHFNGTRGRVCIATCARSLVASALTVFYAENYDLDTEPIRSFSPAAEQASRKRHIRCRSTYAMGISSCFFPTSFTLVEQCPFASVQFWAQRGILGPCLLPGHISIYAGDPCPILGNFRQEALRNGVAYLFNYYPCEGFL